MSVLHIAGQKREEEEEEMEEVVVAVVATTTFTETYVPHNIANTSQYSLI